MHIATEGDAWSYRSAGAAERNLYSHTGRRGLGCRISGVVDGVIIPEFDSSANYVEPGEPSMEEQRQEVADYFAQTYPKPIIEIIKARVAEAYE